MTNRITRDCQITPGEIIEVVDARIRERIEHETATVTERLEKIEAAMKDMLDIWNGAKGVLAFLRWAAAIGATIAAIMAWAKDHIKL